jgi:hypothetical protein
LTGQRLTIPYTEINLFAHLKDSIMVANQQTIESSTPLSASRNTVIALATGSTLSWLLTLAFAHLDGLAALALWPLGWAIGLVLVSASKSATYGESNWGMLVTGQVLAVIGVLLLFLATLL